MINVVTLLDLTLPMSSCVGSVTLGAATFLIVNVNWMSSWSVDITCHLFTFCLTLFVHRELPVSLKNVSSVLFKKKKPDFLKHNSLFLCFCPCGAIHLPWVNESWILNFRSVGCVHYICVWKILL